LAGAFESAAQSDSSLRRMQRFMAAYNLAGDIIAYCILLSRYSFGKTPTPLK
jgi:hypothetical protein